MQRCLAIDADSARAVVVKPLRSYVAFENKDPFLLREKGEPFPLGLFEAAVWLAIFRSSTVYSIYETLLSDFPSRFDVATLFDDVLRTLKRFYQCHLIEILSEDELLEVLSWNKGAVTQCHFALTYRCNLKCKHCLIVRKKVREMKTNEVLDLIEQLWNLGCETINFSGGEVLLRKDFLLIAETVHKKRIQFGFNTNAILIDTETVRELRKYSPSHVGISLYSDSEEIHDAVTGVKGSFVRTLESINLLVRQGIPVTIKTILMRDNLNRIGGLKTLASSLGYQLSIDPHILPRQDRSMAPLRYLLSRESLDEYYRTSAGDPRRSHHAGWHSPKSYLCNAGFDRCAIDPYGYVYPCAVFPLTLGNARLETLKAILFRWSLNADKHMPRVSDLPECMRCEHKDHCSPCPGISLIEEGDQKLKSSWICMATKAQTTKAPARKSNEGG